jgi:hypothetical protein
MLGRGTATHNSIRDALVHMVKQCGLADAAVVETLVAAADGDTTNSGCGIFRHSLRGASNLGGFSCRCGIRFHWPGPRARGWTVSSRAAHGAAPAFSQGAEPKGLGPPAGKTARSQPPQAA